MKSILKFSGKIRQVSADARCYLLFNRVVESNEVRYMNATFSGCTIEEQCAVEHFLLVEGVTPTEIWHYIEYTPGTNEKYISKKNVLKREEQRKPI